MDALFDKDCEPELIRRTRVVVIGYGNQGRAQALNLRDSGVAIAIGARLDGAGADAARRDGFDVMAPAAAVRGADLVALLTPDETHAQLYAEAIAPGLRRGGALLLAHGFSVRFSLIDPRPDLDVLLVAPKGPGTALRSLYESGRGMAALMAVHQDASGSARALALSYAALIGSGRAGILTTSFAEECEADLFNEQAVVWGAVPEILRAGFEILTEAGIAPEVAYLECVAELKLLADLIHERGIAGMREAISNTAEFGAMIGGPRMVTPEVRAEMRRVLTEVRSGVFAGELIADARAGYPRLRAARAEAAADPIETTARRLRQLNSESRPAGDIQH